jgi:hypothetical protein
MAETDWEMAPADQRITPPALHCAPLDDRRRVQLAHPTRQQPDMNKAKAAALIQEQFDRQVRESFGDVTLPPTIALDLVVATWRTAGAVFSRRQGTPPQPLTLAAMALMHGAVTPEFSKGTSVQAYFIRALFQMTRNLDELKLSKWDRELIDATLDAASDLAPHWFPRKK